MISASKQLLFNSVKDPKNDPRNRYIKRVGQNKAKDDARDIATRLLTIELCDMPIFVARDLSNLPPLSVNDFDVIRILTEVESLKNSVRQLTDNQSSLLDMMKSKNALVQSVHSSTVSEYQANPVLVDTSATKHLHTDMPDSNPTTIEKDTVSDADSGNTVSDYTSCSDSHTEPTEHSYHNKDPVSERSLKLSDTSLASNDSIDSDALLSSSPSLRQIAAEWQTVRQRPHQHHNLNFQSSPQSTRQRSQPRKNREQLIYGKGRHSSIKAAVNTRPESQNMPKQNRVITGVFVTRLHPDSTCRQLELHIKRETSLTVRPERLNTRFNTYSSFYIRADKNTRQLLMDSNLWPSGALIKPFFS